MTLTTRSKQARRISAVEAAGLVRSGDWVEYGTTLCQPDVFDRALAERTAELHDVKIRACLSLRPRAVLEADPQREHFHWFSGTGGQLQFVRGAYASRGGKSFMCLSSTYEGRGARTSRIVLNLTPGNVVTTPRSDMMYVVTEYGMVNLKGKSVAERAQAMISIAHPDFRDLLAREARENGLIPRGFA